MAILTAFRKTKGKDSNGVSGRAGCRGFWRRMVGTSEAAKVEQTCVALNTQGVLLSVGNEPGRQVACGDIDLRRTSGEACR